MTSTSDMPTGTAGNAALAERMAKLTPQQRELLLRTLAQRSAPRPEAVPMPHAVPGEPLPLTSAQRQIWLFERLQPDTGAYLIYNNLVLEGALDVDALERACRLTIRRHDALRMRYSESAGEPKQTVVEEFEFSIPLIDFSMLPDSERDIAVQREVDAEAAKPLDLTSAPLLRATLLRVSPERHVLLMATHHIMADAWSMGVIEAGIIRAYNAFRAGQEPDLPAPDISYGDYVLWQQQPVSQQRIVRQIEFWQKALSGTTGLLDLPVDRPRGAVISARGARHPFVIADDVRAGLIDLARRENTTLFVLLLSAYQVLLARYTGDSDIVVGSPMANRLDQTMASTVGLFINTIAFRADLSGDPTFREFLARNRDHVLGALENGEAPLERVIEGLDLDRAPGRTPLFQSMFVLDTSSGHGEQSMDGLRTSSIDPDVSTSRFEITLSLAENGHGLGGVIDYGSDLFLPSTIEHLARHYENLLRAIGVTPEMPVSQLPLIGVDERAALVALGDGGPALTGEGETLHELFALQAARTPDADALVERTDAGPRAWSYAQVQAQANGIAQHLHATGIGRESIVAVLADRSVEAVVAVLGVLAAGAAYLPLDPSSPDERLHFLLQDSGARALLVPSSLRDRATTVVVDAIPTLHCSGIELANAAPVVERNENDAAYLIYTSGSTGAPKGVVVPHRGAVNLVRGFLARHRFEGQRLLMIPPLIFDASVGDLFPALACGSALVLHPAPTELGPRELEDFCREYRVSAIDAPAALWRRWTEGWALRTSSEALLPELNLMMIGGESVPVDQVRRFAACTGGRVVLCNHYGPTEASVCATLFSTVDGAEVATSDLPIGRPLPGVHAYLLDTHGQPVPRGVIGELYLGGRGVARGYLGAEALTAERFVVDPFVNEASADNATISDVNANGSCERAPVARMYRTGDHARWNADGTLQFIGRRDHQIKLRGFRIELGEIDNALAALPNVQAVATLLREDRPGDRRLVAYVVANEGGADPAALRQGLSRRLPEAMLPSAYVFLPAMPLNANGKIDRRALPAPSDEAPAERAIRAPRTVTETTMLAVWRDVLGRDELSTDDDFFAVGGDSLSTLPLAFKLHAALGVELPLSAIFATPTIIGLSETIDRIRRGDEGDVLDLHARATLPPSVDAAGVAPPITPREAPKSVLLTGATGFLGAYVLRDLIDLSRAEVVCLVRADTIEDGLQRIRRNLDTYRLWRDGDEQRLVPVLGDLGSPRLGLSEDAFDALAHRVDAIVHNGGQVNFIAPYDHLEAANVGGTREVLRLATTGHLKPVQLVSTLGVYVTAKHLGQQVFEGSEPPDAEGQQGGYNQSKWAAEKLGLIARERGVPVAIHRPARITGDRENGIGNINDYFYAWIRGCVQLGMAPDIHGDFFDMTPVDYVARAVVAVLLGAGDANGNYHYFNARTLPVTDAVATIDEAGWPIAHVPYGEWRQALMQAAVEGSDNPLRPFAGLFPEALGDDVQMPDFDCTATEAAVEALAGACPPADRALFGRYLAFLHEVGALPATGGDAR